MSEDYVIGVDLGGTKVEACLLNQDGEVKSRHRVFVEASQGLDRVLENIAKVIEMATEGQTYSAVGIGTPGTYIEGKDQLCGAPHTPIYETHGFMGQLRERLHAPLIIENDANCLALAEFFGQCKGKYSHIMMVILGTGMGFGLILDDHLYRGAKGGAGEIGHTSIDIHGRSCECGRKGCGEAYLSGPSHSRRYHDLTRENLSVQDIWKRYEQGDRAAITLFQESCLLMGNIFANVVNAFDLEAIILGGGVSNLPIWYRDVQPHLQENLFGVDRGEVPILKAKMGDSAGVIGAAYLALRHLGIMEF